MHYAELKQAKAELTGAGGAFEIVGIPVRGQMLRSYKNAPATVRDVWLSTTQFAERPYLIYQDERLTYGDAHAQVNAVAAWLWGEGVRPGDRVAIAMRNYPEWIVAYWACVSIGVAAVGMNAWWTTEEMAYALADSAPKIIILDAERLERLDALVDRAAELKVVGVRIADIAGVTPWSELIACRGTLPDVPIDSDDDACIFYTSGTTGFPKGAQLTHRGCVTNLFNMMYGAASTARAMELATGVAPPAEPPKPPVTLLTTPLFHVTANNCGTYAATAVGGTIVLMYRWDAGEALRLIARERVSAMSGVPTMARELINHPEFATTDTSSLVGLSGGGAQVPPDLVLKIEAQVASARPATGYGMTETCGIITAVSGDFFVDRADSAGPAMPAYEARCVNDDGHTVASGAIGELWVKGAAVIKGYINRPEATAASITDGWLHTGDIARIDDDGFIFIVDRKKDMVLRGGENVYCAEVEASIYRHPSVAECCVFGVPDERLGEEVGAAIVLKPGETLHADGLREHCAAIMAKHKVPRHVWLLDEPLPRNASGKFVKRDVRDRLVAALDT